MIFFGQTGGPSCLCAGPKPRTYGACSGSTVSAAVSATQTRRAVYTYRRRYGCRRGGSNFSYGRSRGCRGCGGLMTCARTSECVDGSDEAVGRRGNSTPVLVGRRIRTAWVGVGVAPLDLLHGPTVGPPLRGRRGGRNATCVVSEPLIGPDVASPPRAADGREVGAVADRGGPSLAAAATKVATVAAATAWQVVARRAVEVGVLVAALSIAGLRAITGAVASLGVEAPTTA